MSKYDYDLIVIGGGAGGFVASKLARGFERKVLMVEKEKLGGECTWTGCIPSKALIKAAKVMHEAGDLSRYGLRMEGEGRIGAGGVMEHVRGVVQRVYRTHQPESFERLGIDVAFGGPEFEDRHTLRLNGKKHTASHFVIATGSAPFVPPVEGLGPVPYLTNRNLFDLKDLPGSLLVLGAGPVGAEMASAMNRLGVDVTIIEMAESILFHEDRELAGLLAGRMSEEGVKILTGTKALKASRAAGGVSLLVQNGAGETREVGAEALLVAVGRRPNVEGLGLENAGVEYDRRGIRVNDEMRTSSPNIYACGDVAGPYQFSHMAEYQAKLAVMNLTFPLKTKADYKNAAWCTFTAPELSHVGMTEEEAKKALDGEVKVYRYEYRNLDRARTDADEFGMAKFICGANGKLLGAHILGEAAGETVHEAQLLRQVEGGFEDLAKMIHIYPTYSDAVRHAAKEYYIDKLRSSAVAGLLKKILLR